MVLSVAMFKVFSKNYVETYKWLENRCYVSEYFLRNYKYSTVLVTIAMF